MTIYVRQIDMPVTAKGFVSPDEDGNMNVYINSRLSREEQFNALFHELKHAANGDCYSDDPVSAIEESYDVQV